MLNGNLPEMLFLMLFLRTRYTATKKQKPKQTNKQTKLGQILKFQMSRRKVTVELSQILLIC